MKEKATQLANAALNAIDKFPAAIKRGVGIGSSELVRVMRFCYRV